VTEECGIRVASGNFARGRGVGFEAVAEQEREAVLRVVVQGFFVGGVSAVFEEKFSEFNPVGMPRLVCVAGRAASEDAS